MVAAISIKGLMRGDGFSVGAGGALGVFCAAFLVFVYIECLGFEGFEGGGVVVAAISNWFCEV